MDFKCISDSLSNAKVNFHFPWIDLTRLKSVGVCYWLLWEENFVPFVFSFCPYLKSPWKNVALRYKVVCEARINLFLWEETENGSEIAVMNRNATWPLMIIFLREYFFFEKAGLTCEKHIGTVWLKWKLLIGIPQPNTPVQLLPKLLHLLLWKTLLPHPLLWCQCALLGNG